MCLGAPSMPAVPPPPPAPPPPPPLSDQAVAGAGQNLMNRAAMAYGASQTILTGPEGLQTPANTTGSGNTLLGG